MADETEEDANTPKELSEKVPEAQVFPVIGIGASAGGLEALNALFEKMPNKMGAAFAIVQHLAPTKESSMPELLARHTRMPVRQVTDNTRLDPNTIYLIPPDKDMSIVDGTLQLLDPVKSSGIRHPIDFFFKSLALDRREGAVGVIMSGTGTDGTAGARAIKAELGLVIVQDPKEAKYDGMPRSVIDAGLADCILAAADIPNQVGKYLQDFPHMIGADFKVPDGLAQSLPKIISLIRSATGNDFSSYKESTLLRRIRRRMALHQISDAAHYVRLLQEDPRETSTLFKELLINVTSFFRDSEAFEVLKGVLKDRLEHKSGQEEVRAWVVGCASGEEAYSIAILLREILDELNKPNKVQIFGTDLDSDAIDIARNGIYRANISDDLSPERLERFFTRKDETYQVNSDIREMVVFANHNVVREPPFLRTDLIAARNLLIYLKGDLQKRLMPLFHYALRENGVLFLSPSETIGEFTDLFAEIDRKWKIYQCRPSTRTSGRIPQFPLQQVLPARTGKEDIETAKTDFAQITDKMLMSEYAPPCVVIDSADNIVHVRGDTGRYLKLADGAATMNILEMARHGLTSHLSLAIRSARRQKAEARRERIRVDPSDAATVDIVARPVPVQGQSADLMIIFRESLLRDAPPAGNKAGKKKRGTTNEKDQYTQELELELKRSREDLQASIEELETSNEELKSANEELLSSNEEMQSTNEELETSREELRSVNEELSGVNAENLEKIEQLNRAKDDMHNLLNALDVAAVFLDTDLNIKSYTPAAINFFSLRQSDIGRPIGELSSFVEFGSLAENAREVLATAARIEREVQTKSGRWHLLRIMPYRSQYNKLDGVLLTFFDINERRILEAALNYTQSIVDTVREPMLVLDEQLRVVSTNRSFCQIFRVSGEETIGKHVYELGNRQWDIPELRELLEEIVPRNSYFNDFPVEFDFPRIGRRRMLLNARRLYHELGSQRILLAIDDVTSQSWSEPLFRGKGSEND